MSNVLPCTIRVGVFGTRAAADAAVAGLLAAGYRQDQLGYIENDEFAATLEADLVRWGIPADDAGYYATEVRAGHILVAVESVTWLDYRAVFGRHGAWDKVTAHAVAEAERGLRERQGSSPTSPGR